MTDFSIKHNTTTLLQCKYFIAKKIPALHQYIIICMFCTLYIRNLIIETNIYFKACYFVLKGYNHTVWPEIDENEMMNPLPNVFAIRH